jgi:hypothetical protein
MEKKMETKTKKVPYEAPQATFVALKVSERLMNCGLTSYCAPNQYYQ